MKEWFNIKYTCIMARRRRKNRVYTVGWYEADATGDQMLNLSSIKHIGTRGSVVHFKKVI